MATPADYHLHTPLCHHAMGSPSDYAAQAVRLGLEEIGFSDHNPMPQPYDDWRMDREDLPKYLEWVEAARADYPQLTIKLGLECDFLPGGESWIEELSQMAPFDYLIGSVHYLSSDWAVDDPQWMGRFTATASSTEEIWEIYWKRYAELARSGQYDFLAHPDLVKKFGHRPSGDLKRYYVPVIETMAAHQVAFEISTAGLRKECQEMYPEVEFLKLAKEAGLEIVISSDAHAPEEVGHAFQQAIGLAREIGWSETLRFSNRVKTRVPLSDLNPHS